MGSWIIAAVLLADPNIENPQGRLVLVGGGEVTSEITNRTLELAGGKQAKVAVLAAASPDYGPLSVERWKRAGVEEVTLLDHRQAAESAVSTIRNSSLIWMPGGLQGVLMDGIRGTEIGETIRRRYYEGAVVAGTSAGAAAMCKVMIGGRSDLDSLKAGTAPYLMEGLCLWPETIIDQHFLQRGRFNRLALAVIDHPQLLGIGIDEATAVVVNGREFEVIGNSNVTVIDGRQAVREQLVKGEPAAARNLKIHVLRSGMTFRLDE